MKLIDLKYDSDLRKQIKPIGKTVSREVRDYFLKRSSVIENVLKTLVPVIKGAVKNFFLTMHQLSRDHQASWVRISDEEASAKSHRVLTIIKNFLKKGGEE